MNDIKIYDSSSIPKGDFFHKQWAKTIVMLDGETISSDIEDIELEIPGWTPFRNSTRSIPSQSSLARRNPTSYPECSGWTRWNGSRIS